MEPQGPPAGTHPATESKPRPGGASRSGTAAGLAALVMLFLASMWLVRQADRSKPKGWNQDRLTYLPSGKLLKPMVLDYDEAAADILWIQAMIYFADAYFTGQKYVWLGHMLDIVTQLNPRLYQAYEFGGVVLTKEKTQLPKALDLLKRGIGEFPKDWRLRVYAAMAQLGLDSGYVAAAEYLKPVSLDPDVPDHIRVLSATFLTKGRSRGIALAFLVDRWLHSPSTVNREIFVEKILKLYPEGTQTQVERRLIVQNILKEIALEPSIQMMGLGVLHQYMVDSLDAGGRHLIELLRK